MKDSDVNTEEKYEFTDAHSNARVISESVTSLSSLSATNLSGWIFQNDLGFPFLFSSSAML